jgi:hypothetical protein
VCFALSIASCGLSHYAGIVVFSAVAGSFHFYYKENALVGDGGEPNLTPTYDPIICIICNDSPRSHMFVPCGMFIVIFI